MEAAQKPVPRDTIRPILTISAGVRVGAPHYKTRKQREENTYGLDHSIVIAGYPCDGYI